MSAKDDMDKLKFQLRGAGIDTSKLRSLRDVALENVNQHVKKFEMTEVEKQFPILTLEVPIKEAYTLWQRLKPSLRQAGYYPVLLGDVDSICLHWQGRARAKLPEEYIQASQTCDANTWLTQQYEHEFDYDDEYSEESILGEWKDYPPNDDFSLDDFYLFKKPKNQYIGFFPTTNSLETFAYIGYGNWNACPSADMHICINKYWHSLYLTEIIALFHDIVVCRIHQPVTEKDRALELAKEQFMYCGDIVSQGLGTIKALASSLLNSTYWSFWWD